MKYLNLQKKLSRATILTTLISFLFLRITTASYANFYLNQAPLDPLTTGFLISNTEYGYVNPVSTAGDINNDGYDDIIFGQTKFSSYKGAAYVIYGGPTSSLSNVDLSTQTLDPGTTGFMITGTTQSYFGYSVGTAGDINNDGYSDIIIGGYGTKGFICVIYGGEKSSMVNIDFGSGATLDPLTTGFMITGVTNSAYLEGSVGTAGDINNDGYDDIIIGTSTRSKAYVIYGGPNSSMSHINLSTFTFNPPTTGFMITGSTTGDKLGSSVSRAGDINNDGYDDIIVGAPDWSSSRGAAYLIYGGEKTSMSNWDFSSGATLNPSTTGFMMTGNYNDDFFGNSVSLGRDLNNDGHIDLIIGAYRQSSYRGAAYVIYGRPAASLSNVDLSTQALDPGTTGFIITGSGSSTELGSSVGFVRDINNDGFSDIIVGAPGYNYWQGAVYVIYGGPKSSMSNLNLYSTPLDPDSTGFTIYGESGNPNELGTYLSVGDFNHDGSDDIIIGAGYYPRAYVLHTTCAPCWSCPENCDQCFSPTVCIECMSPFILYQSQCIASCPRATFKFSRFCKECPVHCSNCTSQESCQVCDEGYTLFNSLCVLSSSRSSSSFQQAQEKASQAIASSVRGIGSVVCVASATFPVSAMVSKIVQNTRYLNLSVSTALSEIYQTWDTNMISWDVPSVFSGQDQFKSAPLMFARYELDSPFFANFWPTLMNIGIGLATFIICYVLKILFEQSKYEGSRIYSIIQKLIAGSFNFTLVQIYGCLNDILFYLVLDAKTNPFNTFFAWASIICAVVFMALGCLFVLFNLWTVKKYQTLKIQGLAIKNMTGLETFNERNKYWELFYSDFNDEDFFSQSFFAILLIRNTLSSLITTVFYEYPLMQIAYLIILDAAIILFLFFKKPFTALQGKLCQYYYEVITLLVHLCAFILGLPDRPSDTLKKIFSTGIIYLNTALVSGALGFMFIEIYEAIRHKTKRRKLKQPENIAAQAATEEISNLNDQSNSLTASPPQFPKTEDQRRQESWVSHEQAAPFENFYLLSGNNLNNTMSVNIECSQNLDPSLNHIDRQFSPDRIPRNRLNYQDDQSSIPIDQRRGNIFKPYQRNQSPNPF